MNIKNFGIEIMWKFKIFTSPCHWDTFEFIYFCLIKIEYPNFKNLEFTFQGNRLLQFNQKSGNLHFRAIGYFFLLCYLGIWPK